MSFAGESGEPARWRALRPYAAMLSARFRVLLHYRAAAAAGVLTQLFWGWIRILILLAFYGVSAGEVPMTLSQVIAYVWLGQALLVLVPWRLDPEIQAMIDQGHVAYELLRPADLYALWYARALALLGAAATLRFWPILVVAGLVLPAAGAGEWGLPPPASAACALVFALSVAAAVALAAALLTLVHVSLLWTLSGLGMARVLPSVVLLLCGLVIPLPLFPDWAQPFLDWQPFRGLHDVPLRVWSGHLQPGEGALAVLLTCAWTGVLIVLGKRLLARGTRRLVVQGG